MPRPRPAALAALILAMMLSACAAADDAPEEDPADAAEDTGDDTAAEDEPAEDEEEEPTGDPEPETEPDDDEAEPESDSDAGTSRDNPIPLGDTATIAGWDIRVIGTTPDGTDAVMSENEFNDPPADGRQFYLVELEATFTGEGVDEDSGELWIDISNSVVDDNNVTYDAFEDYCGVIPNDLSDTSEVFEGGTVSGNLCWSVDSAAADSLIMFSEASFSFEDTRTWFALR